MACKNLKLILNLELSFRKNDLGLWVQERDLS